MKKLLLYLLVCILISGGLLACTFGEKSPETTSADMPGITTTHSPDFTIPTYILEPLPEIEREKTGLQKVYDTQNGICILGAAGSAAMYLNRGGFHHICLYIFSKNPLDCENISVTLDAENEYNVSIEEVKLESISESKDSALVGQTTATQYPYTLYQAYRGKDFYKLSELRHKVIQLHEQVSSYDKLLLNGTITAEEYEILTEPYRIAYEEYCAYRDAEMVDYLELTQADLPRFYVYQLFVNFSRTKNPIEETLTQVDVTIENCLYTYSVGPITLGKMDLPETIDWYIGDGENADDGIMGNGNAPLPYNDGVHWINSYFSFHADQYKLLQRIVLDNPNHQLDRVWVQVSQAEGSSSITEWDMSDPFEVLPGDDVTIYISYRDDAVKDLGYATSVWGFLEYESNGQQHCKISQCFIEVSMNYYALYAMIFDGLDLEDYYWDYYYLFQEPWRYDPEETPAFWD